MPLSLSDSELQIVLQAASPLQPRDRDQFLRDCAAEPSRYSEIGVSIVARVTAKLQRHHLTAPRLHGRNSNYG